MKLRFLLSILIITILSVISVNALDVQLISPIEGDEFNDGEQIEFKCQIDPSSNAKNMTLILTKDTTETKIMDTSLNSIPWLEGSFSWEADGGTWFWECYANDGEFTSPNTQTIIVATQNTPPIINCTIPDQEKTYSSLTTGLEWIVDLSGCKKDNEDILSNLIWTVENIQSSFCDIQIVSYNVAKFIPKTFGSHTITFKLSDSGDLTDTQDVKINIVQSSNPSNTAPEISGVPDQTKDLDDGDWTLSLKDYIDDNEDSDSDLNISVSSVDTKIFEVSVDQDDNELTFHIVDEGSDDFTITVTDTEGATNFQEITVTIEDGSSDSSSSDSSDEDYSYEFDEENEFDEEPNEDLSIEITTNAPSDSKKLNLEVGQSQKFTITINENDDIIWYVDSKVEEENKKSFTYEPKIGEEGLHIIKVIVGSGVDKDMRTWDIEVFPKIMEINTLCGNNKIDANETCLTCPKDVPCQEGELCDEGTCKEKQLNKITGYITISKDFVIQQWYYPTLVLSVIVLLIVISKIIGMNKKKPVNKEKGDYLAEFSEKLTWKQRLRSRLRAWDRKRHLKKQNKESLKRLEKEKENNVRTTAPGFESIITFINQKIDEGNSTREIKKALKRKGWNRKQIKQAFKQNDSRKST